MHNQKYQSKQSIKKQDEHQNNNTNNNYNGNNNNNEDNDSDDQFDDLFKIGNQSIVNLIAKKQEEEEKDSSSVRSERGKKQKKIKKQKHKHKQDKHKKKDKKDKKDKKKDKKHNKNHDKHKQQHNLQKIQPQSNSQQPPSQHPEQIPSTILSQTHMKLLTKYQKQLTTYKNTFTTDNENILNKQFGLKQKLSKDSLPIDIIKFGQPSLYNYGLQDRDIPLYKRHPKLRTIIGLKIKKKNKKYIRKLLEQLAIMTNQKQFNQSQYQNGSIDRYFHYVGYQNIKGQVLSRYYIKEKQKVDGKLSSKQDHQQHSFNNNYRTELAIIIDIPSHIIPQIILPSIQFNPNPQTIIKLLSDDDKIRTISKSYNQALTANPHNIFVWLKFLQIQDRVYELTLSHSQYKSNDSSTVSKQQIYRNGLIERKLSIIVKALQKNPNNVDLGLEYLQLLVQGKKQRRLIEQTTQKLLQQSPNNADLWLFLFKFKLSNIIDYSHARLQKQFQQVSSYLFQHKINQLKSGKQVWKIRKCGLIILKEVLKIHRLEGYLELCTAVCCALLEFNVFCGAAMMVMDRKERLVQFGKYWQQYGCYRIGEIFVDFGDKQKQEQVEFNHFSGWQAYQLSPQAIPQKRLSQSYIATKFINSSPSISSPSLQPSFSNSVWFPAHSLHNSTQILHNPQSFIMLQDIQLYLQIFRNMHNWQLLFNITMQNLGLPAVFIENDDSNRISGHDYTSSVIGQSQFIIYWLKQSLPHKYSTNHTLSSSQRRVNPYSQHSCLLFTRYWHPQTTTQLLQQPQFVNKLIYAINLLQISYLKLKSIKQFDRLESIAVYLSFLYGVVYYLHKFIQNNINIKSNTDISNIIHSNIKHITSIFPRQVCLRRLEYYLTCFPQSRSLWVLYVQFQMYAGKSVQQCIQVYLACINATSINNGNIRYNSNANDGDTNQQIKNNDKIVNDLMLIKKIQWIYWVSQFLYRWGFRVELKGVNTRLFVSALMKVVILQQQNPINLNYQLIVTKCGAHLSPMQKLLLGNRLKSLLSLPLSSFPSSYQHSQAQCFIYYLLLQLGQSPSTILPYLLNINSTLSKNILVDFNLLEYQHFRQYNLLPMSKEGYVDMKIMGYFGRLCLSMLGGKLVGIYQNMFLECCGNIKREYRASENKKDKQYYQQKSNNRLFLWLLLLKSLEPQFRPFNSIHSTSHIYTAFLNYFLSTARTKLTNIDQPLSMQLLNKLLMDPNFAYGCLNNFAYCRSMYAIAADGDDPGNAEKVMRLVLEKGIRFNCINSSQ